MTEILKYLINYCSFLYNDFGFRFVDSEATKSFGGNAFLTLENETVRVRFVRDREQMSVDFQSRTEKQSWVDLKILMELISGSVADNAELDSDTAKFLKKSLPIILNMFSAENLSQTKKSVSKTQRKRMKRIFD